MKELLIEARNEIVELRRILEIQNARVQTMEIFAVALGLRNHGECQKPDIVWKIERYLNTVKE